MELVGRAAERDSVAQFLHAIGDGLRALFLTGEAGIGKTTVWSAAVSDARVSRAQLAPDGGRGSAVWPELAVALPR